MLKHANVNEWNKDFDLTSPRKQWGGGRSSASKVKGIVPTTGHLCCIETSRTALQEGQSTFEGTRGVPGVGQNGGCELRGVSGVISAVALLIVGPGDPTTSWRALLSGSWGEKVAGPERHPK